MKKFLAFTAALLISTGSMMADEVSVGNVTIPQGGQAVLSISLTSHDKIYTAGQMLMVLPEGVTAVLKENGDPMTAKGERLSGTSHTIGASHLEDGTDQFTIFSISSEVIPNIEGPLFSIMVTADAGLAAGATLEGHMTKIELTTTDGIPAPFNNQTFTITIGEPADTRMLLDENATSLPEAADGVDIFVKRTINAGEWSTICLPFAMTEEQVVEAFGDAVQVARFTSWSSEEDYDGNISHISLGFKTVDAMEANHPYLIRVAEDVTEFTLDGVDISPEDEPSVQVGTKKAERGYLTGTYVVTDVPEENLILDGGQFAYSDGTTHTKAFTAYFELADVLADMDTASGCVEIMLDGENITTGIGCVVAKHKHSGRWYNLQGQQLSQPQKGLNIGNGIRVFVK